MKEQKEFFKALWITLGFIAIAFTLIVVFGR
jgi:hypothetical protein